ncbi:GrpB family protein [Sporolactobacillus pectinivorans]|uniref:GrpB family protein n=1 Tax=Sporolactobacillus pectinivorans TaxID=1591408 RepID=UPI000C259D74|nr:GrpB family protein [Sporolactobacillus pectinivorans]
MQRHIILVPYKEEWAQEYKKEAGRISHVLHPVLSAIHHIGSTAIPGILAKPTIDILAEVTDLEQVDSLASGIERLGYQSYGEYGISGRRYFCKTDAMGNHLVHLHVFREETENVIRHLAFRDYLKVHDDDADFYSRLKEELAVAFPYDGESYSKGKDAAVHKIEERALQWWYGE